VSYGSGNTVNPICHLLALLGAHYILHVSRIRVNEIERSLFYSKQLISRRYPEPEEFST
jgi:hypothetical protein